nr:unnamed protein product [Digitaria exilis]
MMMSAKCGLGHGGGHDVVHDAGDAGHAGPVAEQQTKERRTF